MSKVKVPETPKERLELAKRYLKNAKEDLKKSGVIKEAGVYKDIKLVSRASGTAYLASLEALKALFLAKGIYKDIGEVKNRLKKHSVYYESLKKVMGIGKDRDILIYLFNSVYDILHLGGYYRELQDKKAIDSGFEKVEKMIRIVEKHINGRT